MISKVGPAGDDDNAWVVEHRLGAVLEVLNGAPVAEVALRYGASRQSIYNWRAVMNVTASQD